MNNQLPESTECEKKRRFDWWKECFLAALNALAGTAIPTQGILEDVVDIANRAAPVIAQAYEHYVVKGLIAPEPETAPDPPEKAA